VNSAGYGLLQRIQVPGHFFSVARGPIAEAPAPPPTLVHVGADTAEEAEWWAGEWPGARSVLVEANPDAVAELVAGDMPPHTMVLHRALAESDGPASLYIQERRTASSLFPVHTVEQYDVRHTYARTVMVEGRTLASLLNEAGVMRADLLLLNCEGAERWALAALAGDVTLRARVRQICVAVHHWDRDWLTAPESDALFAAVSADYEVFCVRPHQTAEYRLLVRRDLKTGGTAA